MKSTYTTGDRVTITIKEDKWHGEAGTVDRVSATISGIPLVCITLDNAENVCCFADEIEHEEDDIAHLAARVLFAGPPIDPTP